jgi:pimeloyl-ACP methyl ester carboxylesterase
VSVVVVAALVGPLSLTAPALAAPAAAGYDRTSAREAHRVDQVPTPKLAWFDCSSLYGVGSQCSTADLPLDYDQPEGAKTQVAMLRIKATDPKHKIGTLFLNPGGPGGSGVSIAAAAPYFLSPDLLARFDVVGFDPRGTNNSDNVRCWADIGQQNAVLKGLNVAFPYTASETKAYVASSKAFGKACSTTGRPLSGSMSTAEVARDMDVLRRAVGDSKLNFLGFSYGTYLGQVYANLFPDRVRSVVIDGVLDPLAWAGTPATRSTPQTVRLKSAEGSAKALHEILVRCEKAGPTYCAFAALGDPQDNYETLIATLKKKPLVIDDPVFGSFTVTYADVVGTMLGMLYDPSGSNYIDPLLTSLFQLSQPVAAAGSPAAALRTPARRAVAKAWMLGYIRSQKAAKTAARAQVAKQQKAFGFSFPYFNGAEAFQSVLCTDGLNPKDAGSWPWYAHQADERAPDFGPMWTWSSAPCASNTWTVRDEDAYAGPFTRRTANPVLVVGDYYDPATNYQGAVKAAALLPNSRLLTSDSWGHTAYGTSACVSDAVNSYLLTLALPSRGTVCTGDAQPFTVPLPTGAPPSAPSASPATPSPNRAATVSGGSTSGRRAPIAPLLPVTPRW